MIQSHIQWHDARKRNQSVGRFQSHNSAKGGRDSYRATWITTSRHVNVSSSHLEDQQKDILNNYKSRKGKATSFANDPQTVNDPQNWPQMISIVDRKWSREENENGLESRYGINLSKVLNWINFASQINAKNKQEERK